MPRAEAGAWESSEHGPTRAWAAGSPQDAAVWKRGGGTVLRLGFCKREGQVCPDGTGRAEHLKEAATCALCKAVWVGPHITFTLIEPAAPHLRPCVPGNREEAWWRENTVGCRALWDQDQVLCPLLLREAMPGFKAVGPASAYTSPFQVPSKNFEYLGAPRWRG